MRSTHESAALPAAHGVLDRLPEASDFSQRVRHLNSVSREAETLTSELRRPAPTFYKPAPSLRQDRGGCASLPNGALDRENLFICTPNTLFLFSWTLLDRFFDAVARKLAKMMSIGHIFVAMMISEDDFR